MLIRNLSTRQVFIVPDSSTYPKTAYEIVTKEQLNKEKAARIAPKTPQENKTITKSSPKKKPAKPLKRSLARKRKNNKNLV